jgi:hypothetical protein
MDQFQELSDSEQQSVEGGGWAMKMAAFYEQVGEEIVKMLSTGEGRGGGKGIAGGSA